MPRLKLAPVEPELHDILHAHRAALVKKQNEKLEKAGVAVLPLHETELENPKSPRGSAGFRLRPPRTRV